MSNIYADEQLCDLQTGGLFIIQKNKGFKFGIDAVLLSDFAKSQKSKRTLDLCTGTGIVPLLLSDKTNTPKIYGIEIQKDICDMAKRSVIYNNLDERITITEGDVKDAVSIFGKGTFDKITCNPPYTEVGRGIKNTADTLLISRHEILVTLEDIIRITSDLLVPQGGFFMVHRPSRIADIMCLMRQYGIEPKTIRFVSPDANKAPNLVLVHGVKNGGKELKFLPNIFVYDTNGEYSSEINKIYNRR